MERMIPTILDKNFIKIGLIDDYKSFIWTSRYYEPGDFELTVGVSKLNAEMIQAHNYISRSDSEEIGIIEKIRMEITEENEHFIIASGRFLSCILGRRIVAEQTQLNGGLSYCIYQLVNDAIISPAAAERQISNFILGNFIKNSVKLSMQFTGTNLLTAIEKIAEQTGIGFKVLLNASNQFVFQLFEGIDRSYDQNVNPHVVFSTAYDNLLSSIYEENQSVIVTDVLVAGEGEGALRKKIWAYNSQNSGLMRFEKFDDARNISTNEGEISLADYYNQLKEQGIAELSNYTTAFQGEVDFSNVKFNQDLFIGDICSIEENRLGLYINTRLVEVIESIGESGKYIAIPTFGI